MVLSNKKLKQKLRAAKVELICASEAVNLSDKNYENSRDLNSKTLHSLRTILNPEGQKPRLSKREKRRQKGLLDNADIFGNGEMSRHVEPKKQDEPKSDAMQKKKRKRDESETSGNVKEKKLEQLKKKKNAKKKKRTKKVENEKVNEEAVEQNETRPSAGQLVVKPDESANRKNLEISMKVYVGGIPYYSTEDDIRSYFEGCGTITCVDCMTFPDTGKFRGIAIITFKTEAAAKRALALDGSDMGGLFLKIQPFKSATMNKLPHFCPSVSECNNRIYVGNLSWDITENDLRKLFSDCTVASIRFGEDKETGQFKGYAHVDFADDLSLQLALKLDQTIVCGRPVRISCAVPKKGTSTNLNPIPQDNQVDSLNKGTASELVVKAKDNQVDSWKNGSATKLKAMPKDDQVNIGNVSEAVENQVTSSGTKAVSSKIRRRTCYECGERGHLSSSCPKMHAADSTSQGAT